MQPYCELVDRFADCRGDCSRAYHALAVEHHDGVDSRVRAAVAFGGHERATAEHATGRAPADASRLFPGVVQVWRREGVANSWSSTRHRAIGA
jgi:hypothetical protein